jgi:hypothetical protein
MNSRKNLHVFCLFILCFLLSKSYAQISYPVGSAAEPITRGLDSTELTVRVDFPTCAQIGIRINLGATNSPGTVSYIPNSIVRINGSAGINITQSDISNLSAPLFSVSNTTAGQFIVFSIKRRANCGIASSTKDFVTVTSSGGCSFVDSAANVNSYNLFSPALVLVGPPALSNVNIGESYTRNFDVRNGGNGCLDTLLLWIKYSAGSTIHNSLRIGATTLTPAFISADSVLYKIAGSNLPSGKLCNGQQITFTENVTFLKCDASTAYNAAWNSYTQENCQVTSVSSAISMNVNTPNLAITVPTPDYNYCFRGDQLKQTIRITNNGTGVAGNLSFYFDRTIPGVANGLILYDTTLPWVVKNAAGTQIGVVSNFTGVTAENVFTNSCTVKTVMAIGTGRLNGVIVPAGSYIDVEVWTIANNLSPACQPSFCPNTVGWIALSGRCNYQNQCLTANYTTNQETLVSRVYTGFANSVILPPNTVFGRPFNLDLSLSSFLNFVNPNGTGSTYICLPLGGTNIVPVGNTVTYSSNPVITYNTTTTSPFSNSTDTLWIGPIGQNIARTPGTLRITLTSTGDCAVAGIKTLSPFFSVQYSSCSPRMRFGCGSQQIRLTCLGPCPKGGISPNLFTLKRINFGLPDNDNNSLPDATGSLDMSKVNDQFCVNGDTLKGTWFLRVDPTIEAGDINQGRKFRYAYIDFNLGDTYPGNESLRALPNAQVQIYSYGGALLNTATVSPTIHGNKAHYEIPATLRGGASTTFETTDSIVVTALYVAKVSNAYNDNFTNTTGSFLFVSRNTVYGSYTQFTTPQNAPVNGSTYVCNSYDDYALMVRISLSDNLPSNQVINCTNSLRAQIRQFIRNNNEGPNLFPFEYRAFFVPDTMRVTIPVGFTFRPGSASITGTNGGTTIPDAKVTQIGSTLFFGSLKDLFSTSGGTIRSADETETVTVNFRLDATCNAITGSTPGSVSTTGFGNGVNTPNIPRWVDITGATSNANPAYIYNAPQPMIVGGGTVVSSDGNATWTVQLQNLSNAIQAPNSYFYIAPTNGFSNIVVREGGSVITPDANNFYRLNILNASSNRTFTISAKQAVTCADDSMRINYGWGCTNYPTVFNTQSCALSSWLLWLKLSNQPSQIQLSVEQQPKVPTIDLCTNDTLIVKINSAQAAYADNPRFRVTPPAGFTIVKGQIEYPLGANNWQDITPIITNGVYTYNVEDHLQNQALHGTKGLPGTIDFVGTSQRAAQLRIVYSTTCDFVSGSKLVIQQRADRSCGQIIPNNLGYDNIVRTEPINITGANTSGSADFSLTSVPNTITCGPATIQGSVTSIGTTTQLGDTLLVTIPSGLTYNGNFTSNSGASVVAGFPQQTAGNNQLLKILVPVGNAAGSAINYSFSVIPTNQLNGCSNYEVITEYVRSLSRLLCNGTLCTNNTKVILGRDLQPITVQKPTIRFNAMTIISPSNTFRPGKTFVTTVSITNTSAVNLTGPIAINFYCGSNSTPFTTVNFTQPISAGQTASQNLSVSIPDAPTCSSNLTVKAVAQPANNCLCDSVSYIFGRTLSIKFVTFTANKLNGKTQLNWSVDNVINANKFNIQRSTDGFSFTDIGTQNITQANNYSFDDVNMQNQSTLFYRIKLSEYDGKITYSSVIKVSAKQGSATLVNVLPNPFKTTFVVAVTSKKAQTVQAVLTNGIGQIVATQQNTILQGTTNITFLNAYKLAPGLYHIKIIEADGNTINHALIKN